MLRFGAEVLHSPAQARINYGRAYVLEAGGAYFIVGVSPAQPSQSCILLVKRQMDSLTSHRM